MTVIIATYAWNAEVYAFHSYERRQTVTHKIKQEVMYMQKPIEVPEGIGKKMWELLMSLLGEQYNVEIKYELIEQTEDKPA